VWDLWWLQGRTDHERRELVREARSGLRIAVRQVHRRDDGATDLRFDVPRLAVVGIARQAAANFAQRRPFGEDGHAMMRALPVPDCTVARVGKRGRRKFRVVCLELLKANDVGCPPSSQRSRDRQPPFTPFTLSVAIFNVFPEQHEWIEPTMVLPRLTPHGGYKVQLWSDKTKPGFLTKA